jgi:hypothetical protein
MTDSQIAAWLLEAKTPSIQYGTLTDVLGCSANDGRVVQARQAVMKTGLVPKIFGRQAKEGNWLGEYSYYSPKYVSTHWSLMLLTELDVDGSDRRFQRGVDYMLEATADDITTRLAKHKLGFSCLWGNILRYALYADRFDDARVKQMIHFAALDLQEGACMCAYNDGRACAWGAARTLWGLAAIPKKRRTAEVKRAIEQGITFLLSSYSLTKANYPVEDKGKVHELWSKISFPLFYQADILFVLRVLDDLGALKHPGAQAALDWLEARRKPDGRWHGSSPYRQKTWRERNDNEETDRWVSLHALRVLKDAGRLSRTDLMAGESI